MKTASMPVREARAPTEEKKAGKPIRFLFDFRKALQAAAVLTKREPCEMIPRMRLLKLLYIADREALKEIGCPITGDRFIALPNGPVLSGLYEAMKGETQRSLAFEKCFTGIGYCVKLARSPGLSALNRYEIRKLQEVSDRCKDKDDWALSELSHEFPEWKKHSSGQPSRSISVEDVLEAVGRSGIAGKVRRNAELTKAVAELWE